MGPKSRIAIFGLCMSVACSSSPDDGSGACSYVGGYRCWANVVQLCIPGMCAFGSCVGPTWMTVRTVAMTRTRPVQNRVR